MSISLGQERLFRIRKKYTKEIVQDIVLKNGDVILMENDFQQKYTHEIPKVSGKKGQHLQRRINITLRCFT